MGYSVFMFYGRARRVIAPLLLCCLLVFCSGGRAQAADGLSFAVGASGLTTLSYDGQSLLRRAGSGNPLLVNWGPRFRRADGTTYDTKTAGVNAAPTATTLDTVHQKITVTYAWGALSYAYRRQGDRLLITLGIHNTSPDTLIHLDTYLVEMLFPTVPNGTGNDPGMFGQGAMHPLHQYPLSANPQQTPGLLMVEWGGGALDFCTEEVTNALTVSIPHTTNPPDKTAYPFQVSWAMPLAPGAARTETISLRFGPAGASGAALAQDVLAKYRAAYPFQVHCSDRRMIGMDILAASEAHPPKNPRGWFNNSADVDTTTPAGVAAFRTRLLAYADASIKVLKALNAQGVITWDVEGEEFRQSTYYGDPRLVPKLAPEMEYKDASGVATVDAYFQKFRAAGLRVGVCLRPQEIVFRDGVPAQTPSLDPSRTLMGKVAYAKKRWGCTLFYTDSTTNAQGVLDPDIFRSVAEAYPDVLLFPENQTTRYYAYTAPFDSFFHQGITSTPQIVRDVYPEAFSLLMAGNGVETLDAGHDKLVAAVRRGDILLCNAWFMNPDIAKFVQIYHDAGRSPAPNVH